MVVVVETFLFFFFSFFSFFLFFFFLENWNSLMTFVFLGCKQTRLPQVLLGPGIQRSDGGGERLL